MRAINLKVALNVLLVDDHAIVTDGLLALLNDQPDLNIKGVARNGREAIDMVSVLKIDIVLMDIDMPEMNGIEATKVLKKDFPDLKIVILTMHDEKAMIRMLLDIGADGYLLKNSSKDEVLKAFANVHNGIQHISEEVNTVLLTTEKAAERDGKLSELTEREIEILKFIAEGLSNKEIGDKLFISHRTVDTHRTNLMQKLGVHNIAGLVRTAIQGGLV